MTARSAGTGLRHCDPSAASRRVAMVTGGAGVLGRAIASRLATDGADVVLLDSNADAVALHAAELRSRTERRVEGWCGDVTDAAGLRRVMARLGDDFGRLDQLVNGAGVNGHAAVSTVRRDDWDEVMAVNVWGPAAVCQAAIPLWRGGAGGRVVNIASRTWMTGGPVDYTTSKAGVVGLTRALAFELASLGVTVNAVAPSLVITPFTRQGRSEEEFEEFIDRQRRMTPLGRLATPQDVAHAVSFLGSEQAGFITGEVLHVCGGAHLAPPP